MNNEKEWDIKIKFIASKSALFSLLPFNNDYMCLLHIQASEKYINHFYGIEQKFISLFQLRSARNTLKFLKQGKKTKAFLFCAQQLLQLSAEVTFTAKAKVQSIKWIPQKQCKFTLKTTPSVL